MHPFFNSTRASMISCPTTNWRCRSGLRSSRGMVCQGMYCNAAVGLAAARLARAFADLVLGCGLDFDFVFAMFFQSDERFVSSLRDLVPSHLHLPLAP